MIRTAPTPAETARTTATVPQIILPTERIVGHLVAKRLPLPPVEAAMYEYVLAGNGLFVRGERSHLKAQVHAHDFEVRGLPEIEAFMDWECSRVPALAVSKMLELSREAVDDRGRPKEKLFHLIYEGPRYWHLTVPKQEGSASKVRPLNSDPNSSYARALIEVHSHHEMPAFWSETDNRDETGFRLYAVLGDIFRNPTLRVRLGIYGSFLELPADVVFNLPAGVNAQPNNEVELEYWRAGSLEDYDGPRDEHSRG